MLVGMAKRRAGLGKKQPSSHVNWNASHNPTPRGSGGSASQRRTDGRTDRHSLTHSLLMGTSALEVQRAQVPQRLLPKAGADWLGPPPTWLSCGEQVGQREPLSDSPSSLLRPGRLGTQQQQQGKGSHAPETPPPQGPYLSRSPASDHPVHFAGVHQHHQQRDGVEHLRGRREGGTGAATEPSLSLASGQPPSRSAPSILALRWGQRGEKESSPFQLQSPPPQSSPSVGRQGHLLLVRSSCPAGGLTPPSRHHHHPSTDWAGLAGNQHPPHTHTLRPATPSVPPEEGQSYHAKHPPIRAEAVGRPKVLGGKKVDGHGGDQHRSAQEVCKGEEDERPELWTSKGSEVPSSPQQAEPPSLLCPSQHGFCPEAASPGA